MAIQQGYFDRIRYILSHNDLGSTVIEEPLGWNEDEKELTRHKSYHGIFAQFSNNLRFVGNGYDFLKTVYDIYGINADVRLIKDERNPKTDIWERSYDGNLDFSTYESEGGKISLKFNSGGLEEFIKARNNDDIELERETDLLGNAIDTIKTTNLWLDGRRVFLDSVLNAKDANTYPANSFGNQSNKISIPIILDFQAHEETQSVLSYEYRSLSDAVVGDMFFANAIKNKTLMLKLSADFTFSYLGAGFLNLYVRLVKWSNGISFDSPIVLDQQFIGDISSAGLPLSYYKELTVNLLEGESLSFEFERYLGGLISDFEFKNINANVSIQEDSFEEPSQTKVIMAHELAERIVSVTTGRKNAVYSEALGRTDLGYQQTGVDTGALTGVASGMWIRQFTPNIIGYKPLKISLKTFFDSYLAVWGLGMGIERSGYNERVRIENLRYFYNRNTTIKLPFQAKNIKRSIDTSYFFSTLEIGYDKGGEYDEAFGLDEYNAKSNFASCITKVNNLLKRTSKIRADMYGVEFTRRKPLMSYRKETTNYDSENFMFDMKPSTSNLYVQRKWQDDFEQEPTGVYSPETATNLRLSPMNMLIL